MVGIIQVAWFVGGFGVDGTRVKCAVYLYIQVSRKMAIGGNNTNQLKWLKY